MDATTATATTTTMPPATATAAGATATATAAGAAGAGDAPAPKRQRTVPVSVLDDSSDDDSDDEPALPDAAAAAAASDDGDSDDDSDDDSDSDIDDDGIVDAGSLYTERSNFAIVPPDIENHVVAALLDHDPRVLTGFKKPSPGAIPNKATVKRSDILAHRARDDIYIVATATSAQRRAAKPQDLAPAASNVTTLAIATDSMANLGNTIVKGGMANAVVVPGTPVAGAKLTAGMSLPAYIKATCAPNDDGKKAAGFVAVYVPGVVHAIVCPTYGSETKQHAARRIAAAIGGGFVYPVDEVVVSASAIAAAIDERAELLNNKDRYIDAINKGIAAAGKVRPATTTGNIDADFILAMWGIDRDSNVATAIVHAIAATPVRDIVQLAMGVDSNDKPTILDFLVRARPQAAPAQAFVEAVKGASNLVSLAAVAGDFAGPKAIIPAIAMIYQEQVDDVYNFMATENDQAAATAAIATATNAMDQQSPFVIAIRILQNDRDAIDSAIKQLPDLNAPDFVHAAAAIICNDRALSDDVKDKIIEFNASFMIFETARDKIRAQAARRDAEHAAMQEVAKQAAKIQTRMATRSSKRKRTARGDDL